MKLYSMLLAGAAILVATSASAQTVSVGDVQPLLAHDCTPFCTPTIQTVYSASYFGSAPVSIDSIGLFLNSSSQSPLSFTLSTSAKAVGSLSNNLASNLGADASAFFTGSVPTTKDAQGFSIFSGNSFIYDPSKGDLLVQIVSSGSNFGNSASAYTGNANAQRAYSFGANGYTNNQGYVFDTKFGISTPAIVSAPTITSAVPEPATWAMMLVGFGAVGFGMRRRVRASEVKFTDRMKRIAAGQPA